MRIKHPLFFAAGLLSGVLAVILLHACAVRGAPVTDTATWSWTPPTVYIGGTAIPAGTPITYNLYIGTGGKGSEPTMPTASGITELTWTGTATYAPGTTVCGEVTDVVGGIESQRSNEACKTFPDVPSAPGTLSVQ